MSTSVNKFLQGNSNGASLIAEINKLKSEISALKINQAVFLGANQSVVADKSGNDRGLQAIDLQKTRGSTDQVAAGQYSSITGGVSNRANQDYTTCIGSANFADAVYGTCIGFGNDVSGDYGIAVGHQCDANGLDSFSFGKNAIANNTRSIVLSNDTINYNSTRDQEISLKSSGNHSVRLGDKYRVFNFHETRSIANTSEHGRYRIRVDSTIGKYTMLGRVNFGFTTRSGNANRMRLWEVIVGADQEGMGPSQTFLGTESLLALIENGGATHTITLEESAGNIDLVWTGPNVSTSFTYSIHLNFEIYQETGEFTTQIVRV